MAGGAKDQKVIRHPITSCFTLSKAVQWCAMMHIQRCFMNRTRETIISFRVKPTAFTDQRFYI